MRTYNTEFPVSYNVPAEIIALVTSGHLIDTSWHNDICPSFTVNGTDGTVRVWVEAEKPEDREAWPFSSKRFLVSLYDEDGDGIDNPVETDNLKEVLDYLRGNLDAMNFLFGVKTEAVMDAFMEGVAAANDPSIVFTDSGKTEDGSWPRHLSDQRGRTGFSGGSVMKIKVNDWCNIKTGLDTSNPRARVEITIPAFRANIRASEARKIAACLLQAAEKAEQIEDADRAEGKKLARIALGEAAP